MTPTPAHGPPFALDGAVTAVKVEELLAVQTELKWLDYKRECDLSDTHARLEFVKDSGAMQIAGGYRLIGVDDSGKVVGLSPGAASQFDEASLRSKLDKYLGDGFEVRSAVHAIDDGSGPKEVAIVWMAPHPDGCNVFRVDGDYTDKNGKPQKVFREGEVFARHGSKGERWSQADRAEANANRDARARDAWRAEMAEEFQKALHAATTAAAVATEPAVTYTWQLDADGFEAATIELLRRNDDIPIRTMTRAAQAEVRRLVGGPVGRVREVATAGPGSRASVVAGDLSTALDRITTVAALALDLERPQYFTLVIKKFAELYSWTVQDLQVQTSEHGLVPLLWLRIAERLYALGGMAIRQEKWSAVRELALLDVAGLDQGFGQRTWHRDALTQSSRASLFNVTRTDGSLYEAALPMFARGVAARLPALRPDLPDSDSSVTVRDPLLVSICSFDLLVSVIAAVAIEADTERDVLDVSYPNFARYDARLDTIVTRMLANRAMRQVLIGQASDAVLARALTAIDKVAQKEGKRFFGWEGYRDEVIREFIASHTP